MSEQAPYSYIADYYESVQKKNATWPDVGEFWLSRFKHVSGKRVLNLGCGPMFYDNLVRFGEVPETYLGVDFNGQSFTFLENDTHPNLSKNRAFAKKNGVQMEFIEGDVFDILPSVAEPFDTILGIGFFGTFAGEQLEKLLGLCREALTPEGKLLKMTWHGARRTAEEEADKLKYQYDNELEPSPDELIELFEKVGFQTVVNDVLDCPPNTINWAQIQVALFQKTGV